MLNFVLELLNPPTAISDMLPMQLGYGLLYYLRNDM